MILLKTKNDFLDKEILVHYPKGKKHLFLQIHDLPVILAYCMLKSKDCSKTARNKN